MLKTCYACNEAKPASEFYPNNQKADGLSTYCKPCFRAKQSAYKPRKVAVEEAHPEGMKRCSKCESCKPLDAFGKNRTTRDGLQYACKTCSVAAVTESRHKDPTSHRRSSKNWRLNNLDRHADNHAKRRYGLEHGSYAEMLESQGGKCAICETSDTGNTKRFHIDHCHDTNKVRGLLCTNCNTGLGQFKHSEDLLEKAIGYLVLKG